MKHFIKYYIPGIILTTILFGCEKSYETIEVIDTRTVNEYIQKNNINVQEYQDSGIFYQIVKPGTGEDLQYSEKLPLIFTMRSLDGKYVSQDTFALGSRYYNFLGYFNPEAVRVGVKEILKKKNGTIRLIIPSRLAFGRNGMGDIPGNASLDLVVKVLDTANMAAYEEQSIQKYMSRHNLTGFTRTQSGLYYKIAQPGTGSPISQDSTVVAEYTGKLFNGVVFDRAVAGSPSTFSLQGVIRGWQEAIPLIKEGGSIRMLIPSRLGYGYEGSGGAIPPFSTLDFDVKVTDVKK